MQPKFPQIGELFTGQPSEGVRVDNSVTTYPPAQASAYGQLVPYNSSVYPAQTYGNHHVMPALPTAPVYAQGFSSYDQSFVAASAVVTRALPTPPSYMNPNTASLQQGKDAEQKLVRSRAGSANPSNAVPTFAMRSAIGQPIRPLFTIEQSHLYGVLHIRQA
jgi:hypothetical protein